MKLVELEKHFKKYGCIKKREGGNHSVYINPLTQSQTSVPRHREIKKNTIKAICKQLSIPDPS